MSVVAFDGNEMRRILQDGCIPLLIHTLGGRKLLYSDQMPARAETTLKGNGVDERY